MPGVIGASMLSPRPGRGYRFHSLHVVIISPPRRSLPPNAVHVGPPGQILLPNPKPLTPERFQVPATSSAYRPCVLVPHIRAIVNGIHRRFKPAARHSVAS